MTDTVRYGVLSTAQIALNRHLPAAAEASNAEIVAISSRDQTRAEKAAAEHGISKAYGTYQALLDDPDVDAVINPLPNSLHCEWTIKAAQAGKHILCEKPVALTAAELDDAEAVVAKHKVTFMTGHQMRLHPVITAVQKAMPRLGPIYHVDFEWCFRIDAHEGRCGESYRQGGFFMELGCHAADLAGYMLGKVVHVSGHTLRLNPKRITEDYTNVLLQFESGAVAQILVRQPRGVGIRQAPGSRQERAHGWQGLCPCHRARVRSPCRPAARGGAPVSARTPGGLFSGVWHEQRR